MTLEIGSSSSPRPLSLASRRAHLKVESHPSYTSRPCSPMTPNPPLRRRTAGPPTTSPRWWGRVWCRPSWWLRIVLGLCRLGRTGCQRVARVWLPRQRSLLRRRLWQCWRKWRWSEDRSRGECASWSGSRTWICRGTSCLRWVCWVQLAWDGFFWVWHFFVWIGCVIFLDWFGNLGL